MERILVGHRQLSYYLQAVNEIGKTTAGWNRLAYTEAERSAVQYFLEACEKIGLVTRVDSVGNAYARWEGVNPDLPVVLCGSHLDTVRNGGPLDGTYGVFAALEAVRTLKEQGITPYFPLEIVVFACEESSRFGVSTVGSKAVAGQLEADKVRRLMDRDGIVFDEAMVSWGYSFDRISEAARDDLLLFIEIHIEQGSTLESNGEQLGIVTGIAAPTRFQVTISGIASHSGATMMSYRRDALPAAAEFILAVERSGLAEEGYGTVATVGVCEVYPGAMNVIPGEVRLQVDVRGIESDSKQRVVNELRMSLDYICQKRRLEWSWNSLGDEAPVFMNIGLNQSVAEVCSERRISYRFMPSGAGHDAMNMARLCPSALIFVPSRGGISHNPAEDTDEEDLLLGVEVLCEVLKRQVMLGVI
ncbi:Zn-dependent hydrolase [Desulfosporosinus sp.]|uniref:Zn-dependent hydrolase n=1 Tax=Desulfosporosinus sp. TaxID=157907 RepID=UPI000E9B952B|nr:Zn-dependent hydrolase [Desulfosporosinus sp.]MBC2721564.1 Zn-dependent hydrolase [Desulfosporosinus sp.]MBC2727024.1 Zn-dependent hydrolase [Desulfosporosinus sp.]HBV88345.1 allantoate amidohydrolase [Desulfosporosinus sp.]